MPRLLWRPEWDYELVYHIHGAYEPMYLKTDVTKVTLRVAAFSLALTASLPDAPRMPYSSRDPGQ